MSVSSISGLPASSTRTVVSLSSVSRDAKAQPAEPAPTMMKSYSEYGAWSPVICLKKKNENKNYLLLFRLKSIKLTNKMK